MTSQCQRFLALLLATALGPGGLLSGCSGLRPCYAPQPHERSVQADPVSTIQPPTDERRQTTLNAVQDFLARTEEYQLGAQPTSPASGSPPTTVPSTSPGADRPLQPPDRGPAPAIIVPPANTVLANTRVSLSTSAAAQTAVAIPVVESISIRTAAPAPSLSQGPGEESPRVNTTNQPLEVHLEDAAVTPGGFVHHLKTLAAEAWDLDSEWRLRLVQLALNRDQDATDVSANLSSDARSALVGLIRLGLEIRRMLKDPLSSGEDALKRLDELQRVLADRADPIVSSVALCRKVVTFGVYEEMSDEDFIAGRTTPTIVYSEIRNLRSEQMESGQYRTQLGTRLEVLTADGNSIWQHEEPDIVDLCRRRRNDFFIAQRITLPPTLPPGEIVLKVLVEDKLSGKANEAAHRLTISPDATRTAGR